MCSIFRLWCGTCLGEYGGKEKPPELPGGKYRRSLTLLDVSRVESLANPLNDALDAVPRIYCCKVPLPQFQPMPLGRVREPFSHPEWIFEVKWDGFRALAYIQKKG
jgi:hypothetical protein